MSRSLSLTLSLLSCCLLVGAPVRAQGQQLDGYVQQAGAQPKWVLDIANSMNSAAGGGAVDLGQSMPPQQPQQFTEQAQPELEAEVLGDSIPMTIPAQQMPSMGASGVPNGNQMGGMQNSMGMGMQNSMGMGMQNSMGMGMQNSMGNQHFHGCCNGHHDSGMAQQAQDPCKMMFGMSQQELGATAAVAGIMLYPSVMQSVFRSNPQMNAKVSKFLGSGPAAGF